MYMHALLTLIATALTGASIGSYLMITVLHRPLIADQLNIDQTAFLHRRFYRLNIALCLMAGILAALIQNRQAAMALSILAVSYIFTNMHVLKAIINHSYSQQQAQSKRALRSLKFLQNILHLFQCMGACWAVFCFY